MRRRFVWPYLLWLLLTLGVVSMLVKFGVTAVTSGLTIVSAVLAAAPSTPALRRWWRQPGEPTTTDQLKAAVAALTQAVRRQWQEEAARRQQLRDIDQMAVRWEIVAGSRRADVPDSLPAGGEIDTLAREYAAAPWPLVVVGDAGSGKTGLCVLLLLELLKKKEPLDRVPVLFQLSSWNPRENVEKWLVRRLVEYYPFLDDPSRFGATAATALLDNERVLPVLDGLDELPEDLRPVVLETIQAYPLFNAPFVLTCRTDEFAAAAGGRFVGGVTVVGLRPIDRDAAVGYLHDVFATDLDRWRPVLDNLTTQPDGPLAATLAKPLMLFLARATYVGRHTTPAELLDRDRLPDAEAIEHHLLDSFIPKLFDLDDPPPRFSPTRVSVQWKAPDAQRWLTFLARHLNTLRPQHDRGATDLAWWQLSRAVPRYVFALANLLIGVPACALLAWIVFGLFGRQDFGLVFGASVGVVGGAGLAVLPEEPPRRFAPRVLERGELALRPLLRDLFFGVVGAVVGGLIAGLLYPLTYGIVTGLVLGLTFSMVRRFTKPTEPKEAVTPIAVLRGDRAAVLYGWLLGAVVGAVVGIFLGGVGGSLAKNLVVDLSPLQKTLLGTAIGLVVSSAGLGLMVQATSAWGHFLTAREWLALRRCMPWRLMTFLDDAHKLGVLRQVGANYQFRHALLQDRLVDRGTRATAPDNDGVSASAR
jgi:hypothetical protein